MLSLFRYITCFWIPSPTTFRASGDITRQGFRVTSGLIFWYVTFETMWNMNDADLLENDVYWSEIMSTSQILNWQIDGSKEHQHVKKEDITLLVVMGFFSWPVNITIWLVDIIHISYIEGDIPEYQPLSDTKALAGYVTRCQRLVSGWTSTRRNATISWKLKGAIQSPFSHHSVDWMAGTFQWPFSVIQSPFSRLSVIFTFLFFRI